MTGGLRLSCHWPLTTAKSVSENCRRRPVLRSRTAEGGREETLIRSETAASPRELSLPTNGWKSGRGQPHSKTLARDRKRIDWPQGFGVRLSSAAFPNRPRFRCG